MGILVGSTGFVGGHLAKSHTFGITVNSSDVYSISGSSTDLLVCAGLPAEKWRANQLPDRDWKNMAALAQVLSSVQTERAVLISTIDVYQPAVGVNESSRISLNGPESYGSHRAWFETFFAARFPESLTIRLPALFASDVRKNLVHDLLHGKNDQWQSVNPDSTFQFFDVTQTWEIIQKAITLGIHLLNVSSEPTGAQQIANIFNVSLSAQGNRVTYDVQSVHAADFGGKEGYIFSSESVLNGITTLRQASMHP